MKRSHTKNCRADAMFQNVSFFTFFYDFLRKSKFTWNQSDVMQLSVNADKHLLVCRWYSVAIAHKSLPDEGKKLFVEVVMYTSRHYSFSTRLGTQRSRSNIYLSSNVVCKSLTLCQSLEYVYVRAQWSWSCSCKQLIHRTRT